MQLIDLLGVFRVDRVNLHGKHDDAKKGRSVYVEGRLKTRKYTDKDGVEKYATDIIATEMQLLGGREGGTDEVLGTLPRSGSTTRGSMPASGGKPPSHRPVAPVGRAGEDDDIPF